MDKALILRAVQDISAQHGEGKEEEKGLTKPAQSKGIILVMAIMSLVMFLNTFFPQELILYKRSGLQVKR